MKSTKTSSNEPYPPYDGEMIAIIDEPSPTDPRDVWEQYLADLRESFAENPHPQYAAAIAEAEAHLRD